GRLVWNRLRYVKDPETGRRVSRLNPDSGWIVQSVADLRIVDQSLWERVKARQGALTAGRGTGEAPGYWDRRRPRYLFTGLMRCAALSGAAASCISTSSISAAPTPATKAPATTKEPCGATIWKILCSTACSTA